MRKLCKKEKAALWDSWVRKPIFADDGVYNIAPRHVVMSDFIKYGVFPFMRKKGYRMRLDPAKVTASFLRYLFEVYLGSTIRMNDAYPNCLQDHRDEFDHRLDSLALEEFWEAWGSIEDFQEFHYAYNVRFSLTEFLWYWIDLYNSPITIKIETILDEVDNIEGVQRSREPRGKEDPYLHDTNRPNYEDRHWH